MGAMRNRRLSSKTFSTKNYEKKTPEVILENFFKVLCLGSECDESELSSAQAFARTSVFIGQNIPDKIECLKEFLFEINLNFNQTRFKARKLSRDESAQKLNLAHSDADRASFESLLVENAAAVAQCLVAYLVQPQVSALRILSLRTIIYLTHLAEFHQVFFNQLRSDIYVMRIADLNQSSSQVALSIEYVRLILQFYPKDLGRLHVYTLLALIENVKSELNAFAMETLLEIACKRPELACECRIFDDLNCYILNVCTENEFQIEIIIQCLTRLLEHERFRKMINYDDLFRSLIAPFVEVDYVPVVYASTNQYAVNNPNQLEQQLQKEQQQQMRPTFGVHLNPHNPASGHGAEHQEPKFEDILKSCSIALETLFNSCIGVTCFCSNELANIHSLLLPFKWFPNKSIEKEYLRMSSNASPADFTIDHNAVTTAHSKYYSKKLINDRQDQTKLRQIIILSKLLKFLYKIFGIKEISLDDLAKRCSGEATVDAVNSASSSYQDPLNALDEEFINAECNSILNPFDSYFIETGNDNELIDCPERHTSYKSQSESAHRTISFSPNMKNTQRAFVIKLFIECGVFEALLDLYFGLPVTFFQSGINLSDLAKYAALSDQTGLSADSINVSFQNLSFKCLNLFAELYYVANNLLYNEFFIDDFDKIYNKGPVDSSQQSPSDGQNRNQGIYNEKKKLSLLNYLKSMNDMEREQEVISFVVEFNTRRDSLKNGVTLPSEQLASLSFFAQKFLSNAGYMSLKKYEMELEVLHPNNSKASVHLSVSPNESFGRRSLRVKNSSQNLISNLVQSLVDDGQSKEKRELKRHAFAIEKSLNDMIDETSLLSTPLNSTLVAGIRQSLDITSMMSPINFSTQLSQTREAHSINWLETIRMFETFLLTSSSIHAKFTPTQDAFFLFKNNKLVLSNQKLFKAIRRLFDFFSASTVATLISSTTGERSTSESSTTGVLNVNNKSVSDSIAITSCYLIDFLLLNFFPQEVLVPKKLEKPSNSFNQYEILLIQFLQNVKLFITNQFFISPNSSSASLGHNSGRNNRNSLSSMHSFGTAAIQRPGNLTRDSYISYLVIILGHLSSSHKGDFLLESFKIYDLLAKLIETSKDIGIMKLVVSSFNYYVSEQAKTLLTKCLSINLRTFPSHEHQELYIEFKLYALKMILNMFRANILKFNASFIDVILNAIFVNEEESMPSVPGDLRPQRLNKLDKAVLASPAHQCVYELALNAIEYILNLRPDLISMLMKQRMTSIETLKMLRGLIFEDKLLNQTNNPRLIKFKVMFLFTRFLLNEDNLRKASARELEQLVIEWDELKLDTMYIEMVAKNIFEAYSVNENYTHDIEDKKDYLNQDDEDEDETDVDAVPEKSMLFQLEEEETPVNPVKRDSKKNDMPKRFVKLYRRLNDLSKNNSHLSASIGNIFVPIHLNSVLVCFDQFRNSENFFIGNYFENKIRTQIELIKATGLQVAGRGSSEPTTRPKDLKILKAAMWSLSALCLAETGLKYISFLNTKYGIFVNLFEYFACFIKIVEDHPMLAVRSTGFYCLNSISKTFTGANLIGKFGWHTFQPNKSMPTKAFCSMLIPIGSEFPDLSIYSSVDTAVMLYNVNRSKADKFALKEIKRYFSRPLTESERLFLLEHSMINQLAKSDAEFIKTGRNSLSLSIELFNENIVVPIRTNLLSTFTKSTQPQVLPCEFYIGSEHPDSAKSGFQPAVSPDSIFKNGTKICNQANCLCLSFAASPPAPSESSLPSAIEYKQWQQIRLTIAETIYQLTSSIYYEKKRLKLVKLKLAYPSQFDKCLYNYVATTYLSKFKLNYFVRKFLQEQFLDLFIPLYNLGLKQS